MTPTYRYLLRPVSNRGMPPEPFIKDLIEWARSAPDDIFAPNDEAGDVMGRLCVIVGPWQGKDGSRERLLHRKAAMVLLLLILAGLESSWNWNEGVDVTNARSMAHPECQEAGALQESYDSVGNEHKHHTLKDFLVSHGVFDARSFIAQSKANHAFELEYTSRLLRITQRCNGPILRGEVDPYLKREAVAEIMTLL